MNYTNAPGCPGNIPRCTCRDYSHLQPDMKRVYIRNYRRVFVAVGWICPECKTFVLDDKVSFR